MTSSRIILVFFAVLVAGTTFCLAAEGNEADRVLAVVDKSVITKQDVMTRAAPIIAEIDPAMPLAKQRQMKDNIIKLTLQLLKEDALLEAESNRLLKSSPSLENTLDDILRQELEANRRAAGGEIRFRESIQKAGLSYAGYMTHLRKRMMRDLVLAQHGVTNIVVSPNEVLDYYHSHPEAFHRPAQARFRQIFIPKNNYATPEEALNLATAIATRLRKGDDFAEVAGEYSRGPHAENGGLWEFTRQGLRPAPIDAILFKASINEVSDPIETELGFTILKVEERTAGGVISFEEAQGVVEDVLHGAKYDAKYRQLIRRLEKAYHIEVRE